MRIPWNPVTGNGQFSEPSSIAWETSADPSITTSTFGDSNSIFQEVYPQHRSSMAFLRSPICAKMHALAVHMVILFLNLENHYFLFFIYDRWPLNMVTSVLCLNFQAHLTLHRSYFRMCIPTAPLNFIDIGATNALGPRQAKTRTWSQRNSSFIVCEVLRWDDEAIRGIVVERENSRRWDGLINLWQS